MARVLNKIIELLTNHQTKLQETKSPGVDLSLSADVEGNHTAEVSSLVPIDDQPESQTDKRDLTSRERSEVDDYCEEKRVKFKISEVSFMLDEIDAVLKEYQKTKPTSTRRAQLRAELLEGIKDTEYALTEARELSKQSQKCVSLLADLCARAEFILKACKHICTADTQNAASELSSTKQL